MNRDITSDARIFEMVDNVEVKLPHRVKKLLEELEKWKKKTSG
jgi:hypothetical protein